jgi:hypothetical protein
MMTPPRTVTCVLSTRAARTTCTRLNGLLPLICLGESGHLSCDSPHNFAEERTPRHQKVMGKVEKIEQDVQALSPDELAQFRVWFLEYDWAVWDRQFERDVQDSRLDALAGKALRDHAAGKTTRL